MSFKPADKLHTVGWNANHLLDIVGWTVPILEKSEFELAPVDGPPVMPSSLSDPDELVRRYAAAVSVARPALAAATDERMAEPWSLKMKGEVLLTLPKGECLRTWVINHTVHHRAILSVICGCSAWTLHPYSELKLPECVSFSRKALVAVLAIFGTSHTEGAGRSCASKQTRTTSRRAPLSPQPPLPFEYKGERGSKAN